MKTDYYSFLLKIWAQNPHNHEIYWRASLRSPKTGELISFKDLSELSRYLDQLVEGSSAEDLSQKVRDSTSLKDDQA